jgi:hypothetical protein
MSVSSLADDGPKLIELIKRQISDAERLVEVMRTDRKTFKRYEENVDIAH